MATINLESLTPKELRKRKKSHQTGLYTLGAIVLLGFAYLMYRMLSGSWQANNSGFGIIPFVVLSLMMARLNQSIKSINQELQKEENCSYT